MGAGWRWVGFGEAVDFCASGVEVGFCSLGADAGRLVHRGGPGVLGSGDGCGLGLPGSGGVLLGLFRACVGIGDLAGGLVVGALMSRAAVS